ncbi:MAG: hypothetical protein KGM16_20505 [Bacteroidota bacterium]|nr:hypothetical protein [Bacteroidota bacterium]
MEDLELKSLLASYNQKLEQANVLNLQSWVLNVKCFEDLQKQKATSKLKSLIAFKLLAIALGILWVLFLGNLFYFSLHSSKIFFTVSVGAIFVINLAAIIVYVNHIIEINKINNSESIIKAQESIARLQLSTINITRILFLQAPFYCTFWWNTNMIVNDPLRFWLISVPVALIFTLASLWLYKNISLKNANKKWFKVLFNSPEWKSLIKANNFLQEIETFKENM